MTHAPGFLDPTVGRSTASIPLASRPMDLTGKVVGLLDNTKEQGAIILQTVAEALHQHYGVAGIHLRRKEHYSKPAPPALIDAMASTVHVAVVAVGS